jgi:hypothetical protein
MQVLDQRCILPYPSPTIRYALSAVDAMRCSRLRLALSGLLALAALLLGDLVAAVRQYIEVFGGDGADAHVLGELLNVLLLLLELLADRHKSREIGQLVCRAVAKLGGTHLARSSCLMYISSAAVSRLVKASLQRQARQHLGSSVGRRVALPAAAAARSRRARAGVAGGHGAHGGGEAARGGGEARGLDDGSAEHGVRGDERQLGERRYM